MGPVHPGRRYSPARDAGSHLDQTRAAYDAVAVDYADLLRTALDGKPWDRAVLAGFAEFVRAAGNGPCSTSAVAPGASPRTCTGCPPGVRGRPVGRNGGGRPPRASRPVVPQGHHDGARPARRQPRGPGGVVLGHPPARFRASRGFRGVPAGADFRRAPPPVIPGRRGPPPPRQAEWPRRHPWTSLRAAVRRGRRGARGGRSADPRAARARAGPLRAGAAGVLVAAPVPGADQRKPGLPSTVPS